MTTTAIDEVRALAADRLAAAVRPGGRLGIQLYVSRHGEQLCDLAVGEYRPGEPLTGEHPMPWDCASKPLLVFVLAQLIDRGRIGTGTRVAELIPEFAAAGKEAVTIEHLLTHTVVFTERAFRGWRMSREEALAMVCGWTLENPPGTRAWYSNVATWLLLAEVIRRVTGREYFELAREDLLAPLGMTGTTDFAGRPAPAGVDFQRPEKGPLIKMPDAPRAMRWPGTEVWGPARDLARLFEMAVANGTAGDRRLISPTALDHVLTPCRTGLKDDYFQSLELSWSRGMCTDPALFGAPAQARVAGHTGFVTTLVLGDLETGLVIAFLSNTAVREPFQHALENELVRDIYRAAGR